MRDLIDLRAFWTAHAGSPLVLCTLVRKKHFGYRAVGAKKIVGLEGLSCGLLSGGCLEGDIERAARDHPDALPFIRSFSTMNDTDRLFGYQAGCGGVIDILFERLPDSTQDMDLYLPFGEKPKAGGVEISLSESSLGRRIFVESSKDCDAFFDPWISPLNLCVIGCGPDAPALADFALPMGWQVRFIDYRSNYSLPPSTPGPAEIIPLEEIADSIGEGAHTAIMLMTHNYEADLKILSGLAGRHYGYIGCLGPRQRYEQMKRDMPKIHGIALDPEWETIVHAPAGLFINGRAPEEIALSIIAQIQSLLRPDER
jgi:xanthine dehydrogenase accessory factor